MEGGCELGSCSDLRREKPSHPLPLPPTPTLICASTTVEIYILVEKVLFCCFVF